MMSDAADEPIGYAAAADAYWHLGWRGVLPLKHKRKWPPPPFVETPDGPSFTGYAGIDPSYADVMTWAEDFRDGNLCLRLPDGVIGIDVDAYDDRTGGQTLAVAIARWGPLPPTTRSTSRADDQVSGIRLYRVPPGTHLETKIGFPELGCSHIEIIQRHHRYAVAWPSIHPEGRLYSWRNDAMDIVPIPTPDDLPWLPQPWIDALQVQHRSNLDNLPIDIRCTLTEGTPSPPVQLRLTQAIREVGAPGADRHDTVLPHVLALMRLGKEGQPGVKAALQLLCNVFVALVVPDGSRTESVARSEFERMITNDNAARELANAGVTDWVRDLVVDDTQTVFTDPAESVNGAVNAETPQATLDEPTEGQTLGRDLDPSRPKSRLEEIENGFWDSRESLSMIRQTAFSRMAPPWGTLAHCAARALSMIPPRIVLPPIIGGPGSLNWFVATVARASGGKGASAAAANLLVPKVGFVHRKIGSGEGIVGAYGKVGDEDSEPEHECIMFTTNEIDAFQALNSRSSSTMLPILREGFFGEDLGFAYSAKDKRRHIPEHSYRMTLIIAAQPKRMGWLLADTDGGTPQRFMWFPASDYRISRKKPWESGPLQLPKSTEWLYPRTIAIPPEAQETIEIEHEKRSRDEGDAADGHALFCREKFAYALTVLDGRVEMTSEDWELSGIAAEISDYTRQQARQAIADAARVEAIDRGEIRGVELAAADESKEYEESERVRKALRWALAKIEAAGADGITTRELMQSADSKRVRRWVTPALHVAQSNGLVRTLEGTTSWVKI